MADLWLRPDQDGLTLSKITQGLFFRDELPDLPDANSTLYETWYYVTCTDQDDSSVAVYCFKKWQNWWFQLPTPHVRYNRRYKLVLHRYDVPATENYEPTPQDDLSNPPDPPQPDPNKNDPPDAWYRGTSQPIIVYTPAFPHTWLIAKKRSLKKSDPYRLKKMSEFVQFTKVPGLESYKIQIVDPNDSNAEVYYGEHTKQNHEYYFVLKGVAKVGFGKTYAARAKAKVTEYRDDYGPFCYIGTPDFPKPKFMIEDKSGQPIPFGSVPLKTKYIRLAEKIPGATGYIYEVTNVKPNLPGGAPKGPVITGRVDKEYVLSVPIYWFNSKKPNYVTNPQMIKIEYSTTYWIRCKGVRKFTSPGGVQQEGPFCDWLEFTTEPAPPM